MGLDVVGHVITKEFKVVKKDLFDFLPSDFRFTFYFSKVENNYKNAYGFISDEIIDKLEELGICDIGWTSLVKVGDIQRFLQYITKSKPDYISKEMFKLFMELNAEHILVVIGDQYYNHVYSDDNPTMQECEQDDWFNGRYSL